MSVTLEQQVEALGARLDELKARFQELVQEAREISLESNRITILIAAVSPGHAHQLSEMVRDMNAALAKLRP